MNNSNRLTGRNALIAAMFEDSEKLKNYYRFVALNPHINLHDACNILIARPDAKVCYPYEEWNELGRQVIRGKKSIAYYDYDGYKQYVFDVSDTRGANQYLYGVMPTEHLLVGLTELTGIDLVNGNDSDYAKILKGTKSYLKEQGAYSDDEQRNELLAEGVAYSLYAKTGLSQSGEISLRGLPFTYKENADFVKEVYVQAELLGQEIEDAYKNKQEEVKVIDDTEEETVSDEPIVSVEQTEEKNIVVFSSSVEMYDKPYVILTDYKRTDEAEETHIYIGKKENLDEETNGYDNSDNSLIYVTDRPQMPYLLYGKSYPQTQQELIDNGTFSAEDYAEYDRLKKGVLSHILQNQGLKFGVKADNPNSGIEFRYPNWQDEQAVEQTEQPKVTPYYRKYLDAQKLNPKAVVVMRLGDFYEVMGENAKVVSAELDLTLTGREVGLPERVPMCGMPYHAMDKYLDKILKNHGVLLVDGDEEPKYIASYAEALGQGAEEEKAKPVLTGITDNESTPFDDGQSETDDDWRNELAAELTDLDEQEEHVEAEEIDDLEQDEQGEQESEKPKNKPKSTPKKPEQGIKDRKRKEKPQPTLFDLVEPQEKSRLEQVIETELKYGSGVEYGKFRIFDKYNDNPSATAFVEFLKNEYGWGGHSGFGRTCQDHSPKGIKIYLLGEKGEELESTFLKWPEVAVRIADLIDDDNYLSEQEKKKYVEYKVEQNRKREQRAEEERQKNEFIGKVIFAAPVDRKQRILDEYAKTTKLSDLAEFLKNEYGTTEETNAIYSATYNEMGVWIFKSGEENDYRKRIYLNWEEFAGKVCNLIENDRYIEQSETQEAEPPRDLDAEEDEDWDKLIDAEILKPVEATRQTDEHEFNRFKELSAEDRAYFEKFQQKPRREPENSPWGEVQTCRTIANGIYEVSTAGHGGVMVWSGFAENILSPEAIDKGYHSHDCFCYEEDCDASIPLRELYDKGILNQTNEYFTHHYVKSDRPEAERGSVPFNKATDKEKSEFFKWWNNAIDESLEKWHPEYWQVHEQAELSPEQRKIKAIADRIVKEGTENTTGGNWIVYFDEFKDDEQFVREHKGKIGELLALREEVAQVEMDDDGIDTTYYLDYCPNIEEEAKIDENTDLNSVLDQSELGGAKTRFKGNVAAIKLVNKLYAENRNPTEEEKKVLSQFVGWGGLSQAFDENNESWKKEYAELKGLLSQEDYEQARSSTLNAYYTAKDVITGIYSALNRFGVKGNNRILEPSMGTGNFFGFMPKDIADGARLYGVELDNLTGRIATKLYPQANVQIKGFEDTSFPNDKFDIVVGNVPFGGYGVADSDYNKYNFKVHDYFLAKSIDKVKPNGIVAIITSKGTMDKLNPSARKYVAERADLLGAIRLPNTAFKQTAGTEAVADILFFRKREYQIAADETNTEWLNIGKTAEGYEINQYFIDHPEMVLGTLAEETGLYGGVDTTVKPDGRELSVALSEAISHLPQDFYSNPEAVPEAEVAAIEDYNVKPFCYKAAGGKLYMRVGDELQEQPIPKFPKDAYQRIESMVALREELHHVLDMQSDGCSDEVLQREQDKLNRQYDLFVRRYGNINSQTNVRLFKEDGDSALLFACEDIDEETKAISKADVFSKRTIRPYVVPTSTDDCFEALQISKNERGKVDISYIEELTGKSYDDVLFELGDAVFRDPEQTDRTDKYSGFVTAEEYLSGFVRDKLHTARHYAEEFPEYQRNVAALEQVQPTPITASEISVRLGQTWVDKEYYKQFYLKLVGVPWYMEGDVELFYNPHDSSWRIDQKDNVRYNTQMRQKQVYGTNRAPAYRLFIDSMNLRPTTIYDTVEVDGQEKRVLNQAETIAAREKQNKIKEEFANWIFKDPERREELEATYNRLFNRIKLPSYDGSYLKFPGMNPAIELKPHQKNAIHRIITSNDSTLLHHVVGSGKTYTMVASIMKMRQLGLCNKAMVTVPNHLVQQWASEWRKLYPNAKILVATKEDLEKDNRQKFVSKVAMGDWDGIIIAQSSFAKIPISYERQAKKLQEEIANIELTIEKQWEEKGMPRGAVKNLERIKKSKKAQLQKLMDDSKKDNVLNFESLGIDYLFVDEAHYYKNLFLFSKMSNVAGISNAASQRASDLKLKCEYLQELHGNDRGVVFATGTPISNSMTEMYTMQTYLQPSVLKDTNIRFFDGWAADFGETITSMELAPSGQGYRARTRFAKFTNLPELLKMYRSFADVQTAGMVKLNVPEAERKVINLKPSDTVIELAEKIAKRAEKIYGGGVDTHIDNMLKVTSDGKKLALDPRCYVPTSTDEEGNKLNAAAQRIYEIWESTTDIKGTQIVFCDLSTPKRKFEDYDSGIHFDAYNELKHKLVQKGIPIDEIAFIHDATTDEQKQALFDSVNSGAVRVLIGSTEKCGAGTNVQKRLVALHHLDTPYRPSDMAQREGRIIRQGNTNEKVQIYTYVTERTFDSYSYQILENKQRFISQIDRGDLTVREAEDIDETTLTYAEIKAITAANPKIKRKMEVDTEIARLRVLEGQYRKNIYDLQDKIRKNYPEDIRKQELLIERVGLDLMHYESSKPTDPEAFEISVNGKVYTDKKEGGQALLDAIYASKPETAIAEYCGFKISVNPMSMLTGEREITLTANGQYTINVGDSASGNLQRLDNFFNDLPARKERLEKRLTQLKDDLEIAKEQVEKPFEQAEQLASLISEQTQLNTELNLDKSKDEIIEDSNDSDDDNYRMLPTEKEIREVNIIDEEDKVATMRVEVLPDYSLTQEDMHKYGYTWDGMLPVRQSAAIMLFNNGVQIHKLGKDDTETEVGYLSDIEENALYGVEKPDWKKYIESESGLTYFAARLQFARASKAVTSKELDSVDERFIGDFIETNYMERSDLDKYLANKPMPEAKAMKAYTFQLLDEFSERIWCDELKYYGWDERSVVQAVVKHLGNEELKAHASEITDIPFIVEKELNTVLGKLSKKELDVLDLPVLNDDMTVLDKEPAYMLTEKDGRTTYVEGLLLFHNDVTGEYYVINDTSAKNNKGNELEIGDVTTVKNVLAYNGLHDGNPLMPFESEKEARMYFNEKKHTIRSVKVNDADNETAVINSVILEYDEFKKELLSKSPEEIYSNSYRIHLYNEFSEVIQCGKEYLTDREFQALREDSGHILNSLYDDYIDCENYSTETYGDTASFIRDYCVAYHNEIYNSTTYYGKDTENRAYYSTTQGISLESLRWLDENADADMITIAAPACYVDRNELEKRHIFYLNIGRDISEDALEETNAMTSMMNAMDNYKRIYPLYLQTAKYANEHYEMIDYRNSHRSNEECKQALTEAIRNNFDGMHLNAGFEDKLIEQYGMERVAFVIATTINEHDYDGRYSRDNKAWAKTIPMSESADERSNCCLNVHPAVLDAFTNRIRKKYNENHAKPAMYYAAKFDENGIEDKAYIAVYLDNESGEIRTLFGDNLRTEKEIDELVYKVNHDVNLPRDYTLVKKSYEELSDMSQTIKKEENQNMEQDKYLKVTPMGYKVLSITKDKDNRNIAIIHREEQNDYIVAARYDTQDGKWAQGKYFATLEAAEEYKYENYDKFVVKDTGNGKKNWIFAHVAKEALVAKHQYTSFFRFPTYSEYAGYGYSIFNNRIKEGRQITDMQSDSRELCYDIRLADDEEIILKHSSKEEIKVTGRELMELVSGTTSKDYDPKPRVEIKIPKEAKRNVYENSTMFVLPNSAAEDNFTYFIPNRYISNGTDENEGKIILSIPEDFEIKAQNKEEEEITYSLQEFADLCNGTTAEDYMDTENADGEEEEKSTWHYVSVDKNARIAEYENSSLFKMPKGEFGGYTYYIPNGFLKENEEKGTIRIGLPEDFVVKPKDNVTGDEISMTVEEFVEQIKNKKPDAYRYFQKPSDEAKAQFAKVEEKLRKNIPEEMKSRPNWVAMTTFEKENGKLGKRPIDCNTGKYASDNDPATWADFDTACKFARENGLLTLGYALDGEDKVACIDLDGCMQENGDFTELAQKTFNLGNGTYCEKSISGKGLHVFGKTDGMDLRSFSKDGDMEFYRKARFIAVTGDYYGSSELKSFDNPEMKGLLESKFDKRPEIKNAGKGVEGFSTMSDRDVYEKACASYKGDRFKALFEGQDLQNNHSNSDMSLMNLLAFWCNGDKDQMLRMFAASGLYRPEKSRDYYECTMLKALEGTTDRYNPQPKTEQKKPVSSNSSGNNGKR